MKKKQNNLPSWIRHKLKLAKKSRQLPNETTERERGSFNCDSVEREREEKMGTRIGDTWESVATGCKWCPTLRLYGHLQHIPSYRSILRESLLTCPFISPPTCSSLHCKQTIPHSPAKGKKECERERETDIRERERGTIGLLIIKWRHGAAERVWSRQLLKPEADSW